MIGISSFKIFAYGLGNLTYGIIMQMISSFLTFFGTSVLDIPGTLMGAVVFISIMWDAVTDPVMGYISDHTYSKRFGKRHGYILIGGILLAMSNLVLWSIRPSHGMNYKIAVLTIFLLLCKTFSTIYATPHAALGAELSSDYEERTKIQAVKTVFFLLGLGLPTVLGVYIFFRPTDKYALGQLNPDAYFPFGLATSIAALVCAIVCVWATWENRVYEKRVQKKRFSFKTMAYDMITPMLARESRLVILGYLCQNIASAVVLTLNLHIFTYTFHLTNNDISMIMGVMLVSSIAAQPYWVKRAAVKDKKRAILESLFMAVAGAILFAVMVAIRNHVMGQGLMFVPFMVIVGFATGGMTCIPQTMIVDTIDLDEYETGQRKEGSTFGCMTFFYKLSQAVTSFLLGLYLDVIGFDASIGMQGERVRELLGYSMPVGLLISLALTILCFSKYTLNKEKILAIQQSLNEKKA